jgi:hypothetical protein
LDTHLGTALDGVLELGGEVVVQCNLEGTSTSDNVFVLDGVLDGTETVSDSVVNLGDSVAVGTSDEESNGLGVSHVFDKGEFFLTEDMLVDQTSVTQNALIQVIDRVLSSTTTAQLKTKEEETGQKKNK